MVDLPAAHLDLLPTFRKEVSEREADIDPNGTRDWADMTFGWCIAKGLTPEEAEALTVYIQYYTDLA